MRTRIAVLVVLLAAVAALDRSRADDDPAATPRVELRPPYVLSSVEGDPDGAVTGLMADAERTATSDPVAAARLYMAIADRDDAVTAPVLMAPWDFAPESREEGVRWPAREAALVRLARLPAPARDAIEATWGATAARRLESAREAGLSLAALEDLAERLPVTRAGALAVRLVADRRLEEGDDAAAARHLWRWLRMRIDADEPPARVAAVVARLAEALVRTGDQRGIESLTRVAIRILGATARVEAGDVPLEEIVRSALDRVKRTIAARATPAVDVRLPKSVVERWSLDLKDRRLVGGEGTSSGRPTARVAVDGEHVYVVDARRVRAVDRSTGLVRWSYPDERRLLRDFDPVERSRSFEAPVRDIVAVRGLVLAVLGDPPVGSLATFVHDGTLVHGSRLARETRTRIVALDARDGRPVWWSGRLDEADAVVGAPDAAIASPLAVDGDDVLAVVSARRGAVESWLVAFDLTTGRVRSTTHLARAESGRVASKSDAERELEERRIRGIPRAQRPVRDGDEIAVVTGAGVMAGVDATTRRLRYTTSLPRFSGIDETLVTDEGVVPFSALNQPTPGLGAWFVAAEGSPYPVAIEHGSGRLRWVGTAWNASTAPDSDVRDPFPLAAHLMGLFADQRGRAAIGFSGAWRPLELRDATTGRSVRDSGLSDWRAPRRNQTLDAWVGRPSLVDGRLVTCRAGGLVEVEPGRGGPLGAWWQRNGGPGTPGALGDLSGDVVHAGDVWLVVCADRVVALSDPAARRAAAVDAGRDATDRAARACLDAIIAPSEKSLADASVAARGEPLVRAQLLPAAVDAFLDSPTGVASATTAAALSTLRARLDVLDPSPRARAYAKVFRALEARGLDERIVEWLDAWLVFGHEASVSIDPEGRVELRSDLFAVDRLPRAAARSTGGRAALARREDHLSARLAAASAWSEAEFEDALGRAGGSMAAWFARMDRLARLVDAGRFADAAATAADLRTSVAPGIELGSAAAHGLRALESDLLSRVGDDVGAREALFDADRDGPALARAMDGGPQRAIAERIEHWSDGPDLGGEVEGRIELFASGGTTSLDARRRIVALEPTGPGSTTDVGSVVVARGLDLEIVPLPSGRSIPVDPVDQGWLGAVFQDRESSLPGVGVRIASTSAAAPADRAGLRGGDWILRFDEHDVPDRATLLRAIGAATLHRPIHVEGLRGAKSMSWTVVPTRRSIEDKAPAPPTRAWLAGDGTAIVTSRAGLVRVELATGRATSIWQSQASGDVLDYAARGGTLYPLVATSPFGDTTVYAVDARTGAQRWSAAVEGAAASAPRVVGSALVVDTMTPDRTYVLDAAHGGVRASWERADGAEFGATDARSFGADRGSVDAGGAIWLWREGEGGRWLTSIDPATGVARWHGLPDGPSSSGVLRRRLISGGAVVATAVYEDTIDVHVPDLRGGVEPFGALSFEGERWSIRWWGGLDDTSRLAVGGDTIYLGRIGSDRTASFGAIEVGRREARGLSSGDASNWHRVDTLLEPLPSQLRRRRDVWPVIASLRATLDGAWVGATHWNGEGELEAAPGRAVWFEPARDNSAVPVPTQNSLLYERGPIFVGSRVLVPTDGGFLLVPRRRLDAR